MDTHTTTNDESNLRNMKSALLREQALHGRSFSTRQRAQRELERRRNEATTTTVVEKDKTK